MSRLYRGEEAAMNSYRALNRLIFWSERLWVFIQRGVLRVRVKSQYPRIFLFLDRESRRHYWTGRMSYEIGKALLLLDSVEPASMPDYMHSRGLKIDTRKERTQGVIAALRLMLTPPAAQRFDRSGSICSEGQLHLLVIPSGTSVRIPLSIMKFLDSTVQDDGEPETLHKCICSRR